MEKLLQRVRLAQRKLFLQKFLRALTWCWLASLGIAAVGIAIPKIWTIPFSGDLWGWCWFGGSAIVGIFVAFGWTWAHRSDPVAAAMEIDRRCGLKERISSSLALDADARDSEAGRALVADAVRRIDRIDVGEQFRISLDRRALLPVIPTLVGLTLILFIVDRSPETQASASSVSALADAKRIQDSTEALRKKIEEQRKKLAELGLKDADDLFNKIDNELKEMSQKKDLDKKQVLVKLNDLAQQLADRKQALGSEDKIRKQFDQLKDLQKGPADKTAQALKNGDFQKAKQEIEKLQEQLKDGKLNDKQKEELAKQLEQMQQKLQNMADAQEQAKRDLQQQIKQQMAAGNVDAADKLQQQLDKLNQQTAKQQLQQMADNLKQAAEQMEKGDSGGAQKALNDLAKNVDQLQQQAQEEMALSESLDQLAECKQSMTGPSSDGQANGENDGKKPGNGAGKGNENGKPGNGLGAAVGGDGARPEHENPTGLFDRKVKLPIGKGASVVTDFVEGPNVKGKVLQQIQEQVESSKKESSDPLTGQRLPRQQRDHAQQYFDSIREGK